MPSLRACHPRPNGVKRNQGSREPASCVSDGHLDIWFSLVQLPFIETPFSAADLTSTRNFFYSVTTPNSTVPQPHWSPSTFTVDEKSRPQPERASSLSPRNQQGLCSLYQPQTPGGVGPARPCLHPRLTRFRRIHVARRRNLWSQVDRGVALFLPNRYRGDFRFHAPQRRSTCIRPSRSSRIDTEFTYSSRSPCHSTQLRSPFIPEAQPPEFLTLTWHVFTMPASLSTKILGLSLMAALGQAQSV